MQKTPSGSLPQPTVQELPVAAGGETGAETGMEGPIRLGSGSISPA